MDSHEGEVVTALNLPNFTSTTNDFEVLEFSFVECLLTRPLESFRPALIT